MADVAITQNYRIQDAITEVLEHLPLKDLIPDKIVAVKPNDTWASDDDKTAVTQPETLSAVLQFLKLHAPRELVVTGGSGAGVTSEIFQTAGLMEVVEDEEAIFFDHNLSPFREVALEYSPANDVDGPQKSVMVNPRVLQFQTLISLAQLKLHETATVTLSMKNIAMSYPAADYYGHPRYTQAHENHFFADMHSFIAAMAKRFPINLAIIVGHPAMIATGPIGGLAVETGLVIASTDPVAADTVGARLLGFRPQAVRHLWEAGNIGLGETDVEKMNFPAMSLKDAIEAFTAAAYGERLTFEHA